LSENITTIVNSNAASVMGDEDPERQIAIQERKPAGDARGRARGGNGLSHD
jgi:hypothetical protein